MNKNSFRFSSLEEQEANRFIEELDSLDSHNFQPRRIQLNSYEEEIHQNIKKQIKPTKEIKSKEEECFDDEKSKERKRTNRVNANRNDYGNEGFLLMILYYLGCTISISKLQKDGNFQKLRIEKIKYENKVIINREKISDEIDSKINFLDEKIKKRDKNIIINTLIDNKILDLLKNFFKFEFKEDIKKKPEKKYMPGRRILEYIHLSKEWGKKEIVNEGVKFYDYVKLYSGDNKRIFLSKDYIEKCWRENLPVVCPNEKEFENEFNTENECDTDICGESNIDTNSSSIDVNEYLNDTSLSKQ